jgi:hypothetical protein
MPAESSDDSATPAESSDDSATPAESSDDSATPAESSDDSATPAESSDDSATPSGALFSCDVITDMDFMGAVVNSRTCAETSDVSAIPAFEASCVSDSSAAPLVIVTQTLGTGCPVGEVLKCAVTKDGVDGFTYYYDADVVGKDCSEM